MLFEFYSLDVSSLNRQSSLSTILPQGQPRPHHEKWYTRLLLSPHGQTTTFPAYPALVYLLTFFML